MTDMGLMVYLRPESERLLHDEAARQGIAPAELAQQFIESNLRARPGTPAGKRVLTGRGKYAGSGRTVGDFLREKHAELAREGR